MIFPSLSPIPFTLFNQRSNGALTSQGHLKGVEPEEFPFGLFSQSLNLLLVKRDLRPETIFEEMEELSFVSFSLGFGTLEEGEYEQQGREGRGRKNRF